MESEASVIKDAGDDPDITNGMRIKADIILPIDIDENNDETSQKDFNIIIAGGEGIGIVTMPGLGLELGAPAINPTPRKMIEDNVRMYSDYVGMPKMSDPIVVTISVPGGRGNSQAYFQSASGHRRGNIHHRYIRHCEAVLQRSFCKLHPKVDGSGMRYRQPACSYQLRSKERTVHQGLLSRTAGTGLCSLRQLHRRDAEDCR